MCLANIDSCTVCITGSPGTLHISRIKGTKYARVYPHSDICSVVKVLDFLVVFVIVIVCSLYDF